MTTVSNVISTLESGVEIVGEVLPGVAAIGGLVPGASPIISLIGLALPTIENALKLIQQEEGKTLMQAFEDVLLHLSPGKANSPTLAPGTTIKAPT